MAELMTKLREKEAAYDDLLRSRKVNFSGSWSHLTLLALCQKKHWIRCDINQPH
jgi:hypothetical protein